MQIRQLLGLVNYREFRETGQRKFEVLVDRVHFIHFGGSTSLHIRGNPTEKLFHIFVFLEQGVKYSECWLEVLLNHICKKHKQTNKKAQSLTRKVQRVILVVYRSILGLGKWFAKYRTGKFWLGNRVYHLHKSVEPFTKNYLHSIYWNWYQRWLWRNATRIHAWNIPSGKSRLPFQMFHLDRRYSKWLTVIQIAVIRINCPWDCSLPFAFNTDFFLLQLLFRSLR